MAGDIWPFQRPQGSLINFGDWRFAADSEPVEATFEGWDPETDITLTRDVTTDVNSIREQCGLETDVPLRLTVSWKASRSLMTGTVYRDELCDTNNLEITLPGPNLSGAVTLRTTVTVGISDPLRTGVTARWAGSILAEDTIEVLLEGKGSMLPIAEVDFATTQIDPEASWYLSLSDELALPAMGSFLLLINSRDSELTTALKVQHPNDRQQMLVQHLLGEVAEHLTERAVRLQNELRSESWPDESIGMLLSRYLHAAEKSHLDTAIDGDDLALIAAARAGAARRMFFGRPLS